MVLRRVVVSAVTTVGAAMAMLVGLEARSIAQFLNGPPAPGTAYMIESTLLDANNNPYVVDDPGWGGSGTHVNLQQVNNGSNEFWTFNSLGGNNSNYYTIEAYWASGSSQPLCLDCSNSGTAPGTVVQVWDCNGTWAQNWAIQTSGTNQAYVIVPGNAYSMALTAPGAYNGAQLTLQNQGSNTGGSWVLMAADTSQLNTGSGWCSDHAAGCTLLVVGSVATVGAVGAVALQIRQSFATTGLSSQEITVDAAVNAATNEAWAVAASAGKELLDLTSPYGVETCNPDGNLVISYRYPDSPTTIPDVEADQLAVGSVDLTAAAVASGEAQWMFSKDVVLFPLPGVE